MVTNGHVNAWLLNSHDIFHSNRTGIDLDAIVASPDIG